MEYSGNNAYMIALTYHNDSRTFKIYILRNPQRLTATTYTCSLRLTTMARGLSSYICYTTHRANGKNACVHDHVDLLTTKTRGQRQKRRCTLSRRLTTMTPKLSHNSHCFKTINLRLKILENSLDIYDPSNSRLIRHNQQSSFMLMRSEHLE